MSFNKILDERISEGRFSLPFSFLSGNEELRVLFLILAIDPSIGGLLIVGDNGSGKTQFLRAFKKFKIPLSEEKEVISSMVEIPISASLDRVVGSLDINLNYKRGILESVHNGYLLIDDFHLMTTVVRNTIINAWKNGENNIERSGVEKNYPCRFCLIATVNKSHYDSSDAFLDNFAFIYRLKYPRIVSQRIDIINSNVIHDPELISTATGQDYDRLTKSIIECRRKLRTVIFPVDLIEYITKLCMAENTKGYRADIALAKSAKAMASLLDHDTVTKEDIDFLTPFVLMRSITDDNNEINDYLSAQDISRSGNFRKEKQKIEEQLSVKQKSPKQLRIFLERVVSAFGIIIGLLFLAAIAANLFSRPDLLLNFFSALTLFGLGIILVNVYIKKRSELKKEYGMEKRGKKTNKPNNQSFSEMKQLYLTEEIVEENKDFSTEIVLDLEEDNSKKGKILRFMGLQARRGLISFTERQRIILTFFGFVVLIISIILYVYLIFILPSEAWFYFLAFAIFLFSLGYITQKIRKEWRIRRAADIGASKGETSRKIGTKGVGRHVSSISGQSSSESGLKEDYGKTIMDKLSHLGLISADNSSESGYRLIPVNSIPSRNNNELRVISNELPKIKDRLDSKRRTRTGRRALSITKVQSGRVIGSQAFIDYPKSIHVLATIRTAVIRELKEGSLRKKKGVRIELNDIKEKVYCSRVSATIIFVIDLSESIVSNIHSVSSSVNWLNRQAYLYRDRVGVVVLKGKRGEVVQAPTSNLNLVRRKLLELKASGATPLASGMQKAVELIKLDRIRSKNEAIPMIILITDGAANIPLLNDPWTGMTRETPLNQLKDVAYKLAIEDCLLMARRIRKEKISLTILNTNSEGRRLFERLYQKTEVSTINFLYDLILERNLDKGKQFINLWSYTLLRSIKEITGGYLFNIERFETENNIETLRIAREKMISSISD